MQAFTATIESLDQEGRGIARKDGKTVFVEGALTGETVIARVTRKKPTWELAECIEVVAHPNADRVVPHCPHFGVCGGCSMQHASLSLQVAAKKRMLEETLARIGNTHPNTLLPAVYGQPWGYRFRARLSVRYVEKKGGVLIGFHEKHSSFVADMKTCPVLPPAIDRLLMPLRELVAGLSIRDRLPQIEVAVGSRPDETPILALVLRVLSPLSPADEHTLRAFADRHGVTFWLQEKGPDTVKPFYPGETALSYTLPEYNITIPFLPTDFTQVNHHINRVLVRRAMALLSPQKNETIADFFCGLGNFTLPIARSGAKVTGIEGNQGLIDRAMAGARQNGLADSTQFITANLDENTG
ncbi:MAG: 23S rRNA (uracil(1939)-C(5))-methyltransferase RlmD, partial [Burkholderiales bacterium]|nr:23S rRNA (uracil(1939)-C(5))-methyltransferase RlmD [Burkholderiales bacterium]